MLPGPQRGPHPAPPDRGLNSLRRRLLMSRLPLLELVRRRVVVLDGAMGSNLQCRTFDLQRDWMGHENASEVLNLTRPDIIQEIHEAFLEVGCDAVETNSFNGSSNDLE